mmetsp:Transcript_8452/g.13994  ORF Transcript_8452/g.13994 Transcript_8452/m.13994 type:complete len:126 (-) Transcript_8452:8-385(-)
MVGTFGNASATLASNSVMRSSNSKMNAGSFTFSVSCASAAIFFCTSANFLEASTAAADSASLFFRRLRPLESLMISVLSYKVRLLVFLQTSGLFKTRIQLQVFEFLNGARRKVRREQFCDLWPQR